MLVMEGPCGSNLTNNLLHLTKNALYGILIASFRGGGDGGGASTAIQRASIATVCAPIFRVSEKTSNAAMRLTKSIIPTLGTNRTRPATPPALARANNRRVAGAV
jgi:hypothetical protein